mmetsp:Transcript_16208/g.50897  ORF Transcript_16208/g.50897 Transcript_16208/m.50897 type:complete len:205 (+) Transcript_16208:41-655(+)
MKVSSGCLSTPPAGPDTATPLSKFSEASSYATGSTPKQSSGKPAEAGRMCLPRADAQPLWLWALLGVVRGCATCFTSSCASSKSVRVPAVVLQLRGGPAVSAFFCGACTWALTAGSTLMQSRRLCRTSLAVGVFARFPSSSTSLPSVATTAALPGGPVEVFGRRRRSHWHGAPANAWGPSSPASPPPVGEAAPHAAPPLSLPAL